MTSFFYKISNLSSMKILSTKNQNVFDDFSTFQQRYVYDVYHYNNQFNNSIVMNLVFIETYCILNSQDLHVKKSRELI